MDASSRSSSVTTLLGVLLLFLCAAGLANAHNSSDTHTYLYVWTGPLYTRLSRDFLVTIDVTPSSPHFGKVLSVTDTPFWASDPHHVGLNVNGTVLGGGGLHSFLRHQPDWFFFDVGTTPWAPTFIKSDTPELGAVPDDLIGLRNGGFMGTLMADKSGGGSGRLVEYDAQLNRVAEHPRSGKNITNFNPHGLAINERINRMVSVDFVQLSSTLNVNPGPLVARQTFRIWDFKKREIIKIIDLGTDNAAALMTARFVGKYAYFNDGKGKIWGVNTLTYKYQVVYKIPEQFLPSGHCLLSQPIHHGSSTRFIISIYLPSVVQLLVLTSPWKMEALDTFQMSAKAGPHANVVSPDGKMVAVSDYFLNQDPSVGKLQFAQDCKVRLFTITPHTKKLRPCSPVSDIDFKTAFPKRGPANPHDMAFKTGPPPPANFKPWDPETDIPVPFPTLN